MPQVCRYWQQGNCKYGDNCRFDHGKGSDPRQLNDAEIRQLSTDQIQYVFDKQVIISDLTVEKPKWVLSAYGPGRQAPAQLFGGFPREQSFEEIRLLHFMASTDQHRLQQVISSVDKLMGDSEQQIQYIVQNIDAAVKYLIEARKQHPNRVDICRQSEKGRLFATPAGTQNSSSFQIPQTGIQNSGNSIQQISTTATGFGKPSVPVFGIPTPATSAFGQPSAIGRPSVFGQPSVFGKPSAFGQPSALGQKTNPFGNVTPTAGLSTQTSGVFGNPQTNAGNVFSAGQVLNPFEEAKLDSSKNPSNTGIFGNQNPFNSTTFVKFGSPSVVNQAQGRSAQTTQSNSSFNQGPEIPFGAPVATSNKIITTASNYFSPLTNISEKPSSMANNFNSQPISLSQIPPNQAQTHSLNVAPRPFIDNTSNYSAGPPKLHQNTNHPNTLSGPQKGLTSFNNKRVQYKGTIPGFINDAKIWERIWFPEGKPVFSIDLKMPTDTVYDELTGKAYAYARKNRKFEDGLIPALPPKEEWCSFDF